jgi:hypothetical protein
MILFAFPNYSRSESSLRHQLSDASQIIWVDCSIFLLKGAQPRQIHAGVGRVKLQAGCRDPLGFGHAIAGLQQKCQAGMGSGILGFVAYELPVFGYGFVPAMHGIQQFGKIGARIVATEPQLQRNGPEYCE